MSSRIDNVIELEYEDEYVMAFCYCQNAPVLVKGSLDRVMNTINKMKGHFHYRLVKQSKKIKGEYEGVWLVKSPPDKTCMLVDRFCKNRGSKYIGLVLISHERFEEIDKFNEIPHEHIEVLDTI